MRSTQNPSFLSQTNQRFTQWKNHKFAQKLVAWNEKYLPMVARSFICLYFLNLAIQDFEYYYSYNVPGFPWTAVPLIPCTLAVLVNFKVHIFASFVAFAGLKDSLTITYFQFKRWLSFNQPLYINELMVKKFSTLGCIILILANDPYFKKKMTSGAKALVGLITSEDSKGSISKRSSLALLLARLLISSLFLFVGYGEISRQIALTQFFVHQGHVHERPSGDGHDSMWPKLVEFALCLPFVVGFQTKNVARLLALSLSLEALVYWQFWAPAEGLPFWYSTHARDHFTVNIGVAGGLLLFQTIGAGRYSVDALLKKKE